MRVPVLVLPWFVAAPGLVAIVAGLGMAMNFFVGPYFERSYLDEPDPLAGVSVMDGEEPDGTGGTVTPAAVDPTPVPGGEPTTASGPSVLATGEFRDGEPGHFGRGNVRIGRDPAGTLFLVFENFSVTNGPDLHVILSGDPNGSGSGLDLGALRATDGNFNYEIPAGTNVDDIQSVTIWCKSFPTIFAVATLER